MLLLRLFGKFLSPYSKICNRTSFARFTYPYGRTREYIPERRSVLWTPKEGQSNKKCSVSSIPSLLGHIGFIVSLKLCWNLWKFNLLRPTLSWVRWDRPFGSWMPNTDFVGGRILDSIFVLKTATEDDNLISGSSLFHSEKKVRIKARFIFFCPCSDLPDRVTTFTKRILDLVKWRQWVPCAVRS